MKRKFILLISITAVVAIGLYLILRPRREEIVLTGIVTTDEVIVSPEIQGRLQQLLVRAGDTVTNGQLLAVMQPQEWRADALFYTNTARQSSAQVVQAAADLQFQEEQTSNLIWQSEANLAAAKDQIDQAEADAENAALTFKREEGLYKQGVDSVKDYDSARTAYDAVKARVQSLRKQAIAAQAAVALAKSTIEQTAARRAALASSRDQQAASDAQSEKADVQLGYTLIHAPITGTVDVRAALQGEVVNPGQGVVTLIDPDDLWVRADVGETYIDSIRINDTFQVRLPSGAERQGTVFFRGVDADYATQRDVSRTKRDIKTFEIRLRCDNKDRALAVGMTAYVILPPVKP
ncbi:MAG TPA: efflux RND transporter periplasmic adaptor subunit [Candidatus Baltobacteraceae bacterium]|jgi:multidrug resistance efflux pump|nr:efflux RND transporter periplasmic adaptor subunit [Candidatus Baltobacteraceae bacterium]